MPLSASPASPATLAALAPRPCLVRSNGAPHRLEAAVTSTVLAGKFTPIVSADQVQVYKPNPQVYALVPAALGLPQEERVFVSSHSFEVMGAKA